jgi:putative transposase
MGTLGIQGICGRRKVITTRRDPRAIPAPDLVQRGFGAAEIDRLYVGDITYSAQPVVMCSRMGVGLAFAW